MGSFDRDMEHLTGQDIGCADAPGDHGSAGAVDPGIRSLGTAKAEFHHAVSLGSMDDAGRLGGDQALMVDNIQNGGLHQLGLHDGSDDLHHGLPGKDHRSFRDGVDISCEMIAPQIIEELFRKQTGGTQVLDVFVIERQLFDIVNYLIQPCGDGIPIAAGIGKLFLCLISI